MSQADLDQFYELLGRLASQPGQGRPLSEYTGRSGWPHRGVYFFREPAELRRNDPATWRIVRVGTHAVSAGSKSTLWGRIRTHRGSRDGKGNHRGSIFRLHVGNALLQRDRSQLEDLPTWGIGSSAPRETRATEIEHERRVSAYLGQMSVLWVTIPDEASPASERAYIEQNSIALLSNRLKPTDPPSPAWLGLHSPRREIQESGLWNLNHVDQKYDPAFLQRLRTLIEASLR